jgi:hypothetical protein
MNSHLLLDKRLQRIVFLQLRLDLVEFIAVCDRPSSILLKVDFLCLSQEFPLLDSLVAALLFVLILIAHVRVSLGHMPTESLSFRVLSVADWADVLQTVPL